MNNRGATPKHSPTEQQQAAIEAFNTGEDTILVAFAGAAKTTTLKMMAESDTKRKGILACFNRSTADQAKTLFPRSTTASTMHSLAFRAVGVEYKHRLNSPRVTAKQTALALGIDKGFKLNEATFLAPWALARMVTDTVTRFCYSADDLPMAEHVKFIPGTEGTFDELAELVARYANKAWNDIRDKGGQLKFQHDHYLKMWALTGPKLTGEYLMVDEAQDSNPLVIQVVNMQKHMQKVLVGDPYQQIYEWRGAVDALSTFPAEHRLALSQSFRFGPAVATEANKWLSLLGASEDLRGFDKISSELVELDEPKAILCRTNATVIAEAMRIQESGKSIAIIGGTDEIKRFAQAADDLQHGRSTSHPDLIAFANWTDVKNYVEEEEVTDLRVLVNMIDTYGVGEVMRVADTAIDQRYADVVLSTAHKSKGLEFESVKIASDFKEPIDPDTGERKMNKGEFRLAYVAITRAKNQLDRTGVAWIDEWMPESDVDLLLDAGEPIKPYDNPPLDALRRNVSGKVASGEAEPVIERTLGNGRTIPKARRKRKARPVR